MKKLLLFVALLALTACGTKRTITETSTTDTSSSGTNAARTAFVRGVEANNLTTGTLTAKISLDLNIASKSVALTGTLKMKKNDVIQLSLTLLFVEVARIEFSPSEVLIIDRVHKQYVRAAYSDVSFLAQAGLNFYSLQALFWHELFVPGSEAAKVSPERFILSSAGDHTLLSITDAPELNYDFLAGSNNHLINRLSVEGKSTAQKGKFVWRYSDFTQVAGKSYPKKMSLSVSEVGKDINATFSLSALGTDNKWEGHTTPSSKYRQRTAAEVLKNLF